MQQEASRHGEHLASIGQLLRLLEIIRATSPQMPAQMLLTLLLIAQKPGITALQLMDETDLAQSSISRNTSRLREGSGLLPGYGFVHFVLLPTEPLVYSHFLTTRGRGFVAKLLSVLEGRRVKGSELIP